VGEDPGDWLDWLGLRVESGVAALSIHARAGKRVVAELFEPGAEAPFRTSELERRDDVGEPFEVWAGELGEVPAQFDYVVRVDDGPELIDPYARTLSGGEVWGESDDLRGAGIGRRFRGRHLDRPFDWQGVGRPRVDAARRLIYELHVRGFTRHATSGARAPGTYLGVLEKIPHLVEMGVTTVELLPVFEFDETENPRRHPETGERLLNYWGYNPVSFFAPKAGYAAGRRPGAAGEELRMLVRELHRAGIEVVLDVVFNHTAEGGGGELDPLLSWRGLDESAYYLLDDEGRALDFTGCGNTVNANHPVTRRLILDALRHWVREYRVDGFRFDLAAAFFRAERGELLATSPIVDAISRLPEMEGRLLIAEPWDARGFTPPRGFPEPWLEWDGEFRDEVRSFVGGLRREAEPLLDRLAGVGPQGGRVPAGRAVRFVTCHDGRTLADVVSRAEKRNRANGENDHDGSDVEVAWNGGVEGPAADPGIRRRREREVRLLAVLLASAPGTPLWTAGDELLRSQGGNNNAWCQDNPVGWVDWKGGPEGEAFHRFWVRLQTLRREHLAGVLERWSARIEPFREGAEAKDVRSFLFVVAGGTLEPAWILALNAGDRMARFPMPSPPLGRRWRMRLDTSRRAGEEVFLDDEAPFLAFETTHLAVAAGAARILTAEALPRPERS